jgi:hypothetical protein
MFAQVVSLDLILKNSSSCAWINTEAIVLRASELWMLYEELMSIVVFHF